MARSCTRCNVGGAFTNSSNIPVPIFAVFCTSILALAEVSALIEACAPPQTFAIAPNSPPAPGLSGIYTDEDLQKTTKLALKLFV